MEFFFGRLTDEQNRPIYDIVLVWRPLALLGIFFFFVTDDGSLFFSEIRHFF